MKNIFIYGLQRSGSNFLERILVRNFKIRIANRSNDRKHPLQKHFRLYDEKEYIPEPRYVNDLSFNNFQEYVDSLNFPDQIDAIFVVSKDPYSWYTSYLNWAKRVHWDKPNYHYILEYNLFYKKWLEFSEQDQRIFFIRYIDLLSKGENTITCIQEKFDLNKSLLSWIAGPKTQFKSVKISKQFDKDRLDFYLNKDYLKKLDATEKKLIDDNLNVQVVKQLGYELL